MKVIIVGAGYNPEHLNAVVKALEDKHCDILMIDNKPRPDIEAIAEQLRMSLIKKEAFPISKSKYHK